MKEKIKIKGEDLYSIVVGILEHLEMGDFLSSDTKRGKINREFALIAVYEYLLLYFEPQD